MSFAAALKFICTDFPTYITVSINQVQGIHTAVVPRTGDTTEDYLSGSEKSTSDSDSDSDIEHEFSGSYQQTGHKHLPGSLAISFHSTAAKSVDRGGLTEDFKSTDPTSVTNPDTKVASEQIQGTGFFGFPPQKRPFAVPFVSGLQSKLRAVAGFGGFGGPKGSNAAESQPLTEFFLSSAEEPASSKAIGSSVSPCSIEPSYSSQSANVAVFPSPKSQPASTLCPEFCRSKLSSAPRTHNSGRPPNTSPPITEPCAVGVPPVEGPFANFVHLPPPLAPDRLYTTLLHSAPQRQSTSRAVCTPALNNEMADPTSSPKSTATTPKNIPWNRVYEIHISQLHGHLRFLKLLAANKGHSQPLTQCISRAEALLNDATTAAAASGVSTAGPVPAKPEKRRRSVRFEDEVVKQIKPGKKTKTAHSPIQRPKMRHAKPSKVQIAALSTALGKRGRDEPSGSDDSSVGDIIGGRRAIRKKIRKEYYTPGMVLEFEGSDSEDDEEFAPPGNGEGEEERLGADGDSDSDSDSDEDEDEDEDEDGEEEEKDPSPSPEVDRKRFKDGGVEGKRTADKDVNRARTAKEGVENTTAAKDIPESSKKRKVVLISIPKGTAPSTEEESEAGRGKRIRPS